MYPLGKCYILSCCLFLWTSHSPLFLALNNVSNIWWEFVFKRLVCLSGRDRSSISRVLWPHLSLLRHKDFRVHGDAVPPVCCRWLLTAVCDDHEAHAVYATCHTDLRWKLVTCKSSLYSYPNPVPNRWAIIAGAFLKLTCDPCKQAKTVSFPSVGLFSPLSLLFPLFLYLQWNCNAKNYLNRGASQTVLPIRPQVFAAIDKNPEPEPSFIPWFGYWICVTVLLDFLRNKRHETNSK